MALAMGVLGLNMAGAEGGQNVCEVRIVVQGNLVELHYDVTSGEKADVE